MFRTVPFTLGLLVSSLLIAVVAGAENPVAGTWKCISTKTPLGDLSWTVKIEGDPGSFQGTASCDELGSHRLSEIKLVGDAFSFVFYPSGNYVIVKTKIDQQTMAGTWEMDGGGGGEFNGKRISEPQP
jgi:hypothetical protein